MVLSESRSSLNIIFLVLKQVHPDTGISNKVMAILNSHSSKWQYYNIWFD